MATCCTSKALHRFKALHRSGACLAQRNKNTKMQFYCDHNYAFILIFRSQMQTFLRSVSL